MKSTQYDHNNRKVDNNKQYSFEADESDHNKKLITNHTKHLPPTYIYVMWCNLNIVLFAVGKAVRFQLRDDSNSI